MNQAIYTMTLLCYISNFFLQSRFNRQIMRFVESEMMSNRFGWNNQKNYWCFTAVVAIILACVGTFTISATLFISLAPSQYSQAVYPIFQSHKNDEKRLLTVYQNQALKHELCSRESNFYVGNALDKEEFCNLKYQPLPSMKRPFDIYIEGLNLETVKFVKICLLKKGIDQEEYRTVSQDLLLQNMDPIVKLNKKYLCQRYRAHQKVYIGNYIEIEQLFFIIIQLQLNEKGAKVGKIDSKLVFQEQVSFLMRIWIDYYLWIGSLIILAITVWMTVVAIAITCSSYFNLIKNRKREREELINLRCKGQ